MVKEGILGDNFPHFPLVDTTETCYNRRFTQHLLAASNDRGVSMDLNIRAFRTVQAALSDSPAPNKRQEASRKGGIAGGRARAKSMNAAKRAEIARGASLARWNRRRDLEKVAATVHP